MLGVPLVDANGRNTGDMRSRLGRSWGTVASRHAAAGHVAGIALLGNDRRGFPGSNDTRKPRV